jgi:hypothetical protein
MAAMWGMAHQSNPVALEKPYFIGFFAPQLSLAEREGFAPPYSKTLINMGFLRRSYSVVVPLLCTNENENLMQR